MTELKDLNVSNNQLTSIPIELFSLNKLVTLNFTANQLTLLPSEI